MELRHAEEEDVGILHRSARMRETQKRDRARELRRNMTDAEHALWRHLRMRQLGGFRFRRQYPVGPYIADFACVTRKLLVEVDGGQHGACASDSVRDAFLRRNGFRVLRFWNHDVLANPFGVCELIASALAEERPHPNPPP